MGMLLGAGDNQMTGVSVALRVLIEGRRDGLSDEEILERSPVVLALTPPHVAAASELPSTPDALMDGSGAERGDDHAILREALRLRVRWLQELTGRAAWDLGARLANAGELRRPQDVRHLPLDVLEALATKRAVTVGPVIDLHEHDFGEPLPAAFQLSDTGYAIPVEQPGRTSGGTGAGGGVRIGPVTHDDRNPPAGAVLVTTTLKPSLGPLLPTLNGLVAETGSVLSHLAILARESGVATVVGFHGATTELQDGMVVRVDGITGDVTVVEKEPA
jgi:pyruvate,water dikinase